MKVCSVIVTYGDRFYLLKQVIDACLNEGIDKIIVIDNASVKNSKEQLKQYEKELERLHVIYLDENTGSAGGYKRGLQEAYKCEECEYILTLDDDNVIAERTLSKLTRDYTFLKKQYGKEICISYYRELDYFNEWINGNNHLLDNCYYRGFNIFYSIKKRLNAFFKTENTLKKDLIRTEHLNIIPVAPYSGLFFAKSIIEETGVPNEKFFLYADDFEFTYRISQKYPIFLDQEIKIEDIDISWSNYNEKLKLFYHPFINTGTEFKTYYLFRNSEILENFIFNKKGLCFFVNKYIYILILVIIGFLNFKIKRIITIIKALKDAKRFNDE